MKALARCLLRAFFSLFYDSRYLRGRWFAVGIDGWLWCLFGLIRRQAPWPVSPLATVTGPVRNILFHPDDLNNFQSPGCYWQAHGLIEIGKGSMIGPNVGLITQNHDKQDVQKHVPSEPIKIGADCWIGMNAVILPGVALGDNTIVGAGAVVTHSFGGHCVIVGNPAEELHV